MAAARRPLVEDLAGGREQALGAESIRLRLGSSRRLGQTGEGAEPVHGGGGRALTEMPDEVMVAEARVVASRLVAWFRERLVTAEEQRDAADRARESAEDSRREAVADRGQAERRVIDVEQLLVASEELSEQLQHALDTRIVIEQAKGFLVARHGATPDEAFEAMRRYARRNRVALRDVAADVMTGTPELGLGR